jgi:DinB superfamily
MAAGPDLDGPCRECGFDPHAPTRDELVQTIRAFPRRYRAPFTRFLPGEDGAALLRKRPEPEVWSALEYGAHVADVFALFARRVDSIVSQDRPALEVIDWDALVDGGAYDDVDPADVVDAVAATSEVLADLLDGLSGDEWERVGTRAGETRSVDDLARRAVHEGSHHLLDVGRALRTVRGR